jgi:hypothetical protein
MKLVRSVYLRDRAERTQRTSRTVNWKERISNPKKLYTLADRRQPMQSNGTVGVRNSKYTFPPKQYEE